MANIKEIVREKYAQIATAQKSSCGCGCKNNDVLNVSDDYGQIEGYVADSDLGLGCGLPTKFAAIKPGDTVVDLGSGAGNDVFIARQIVGDAGQVIGIDMTEEMIAKANQNNRKLGFTNVSFKYGEIEDLPVQDNLADVIVSNCVINLVPDKNRAFAEMYRVLKPGGHFCVSDIVIEGTMPQKLKKSAAMYAGCISGATDKNSYLEIIRQQGFENIEIKATKTITLPDDLLGQYATTEEIQEFKQGRFGLFSITVVGVKN